MSITATSRVPTATNSVTLTDAEMKTVLYMVAEDAAEMLLECLARGHW